MGRLNPSRRAVLCGAASLLPAVPGCVSRSDGRSDETPSPGTAARSATETAADPGSIRLPAVDAAGSPGGTVGTDPAGTATLLDFFATWCAPCKAEMEHLRAVRERFDEDDLFMISITQQSNAEAVAAFWREYDGTWPAVIDPKLRAAQAYEIGQIPTIVVLSPDDVEIARHTGLVGEQQLTESVEAALGG